MQRMVRDQALNGSRRLGGRGGRVPAALASPLARRLVLALALVMLLRTAMPVITCAAHPATAAGSHHTPVDLLAPAHAGHDHAGHHHDAGPPGDSDGRHCHITSGSEAHTAVLLLQPDPFLLTGAALLAWPAFTVLLAAARTPRPAGALLPVFPRPPSC